MGTNCAVISCNSSGRMPETKFFRFPLLNHKSNRALALTQTRQDAWVTALNRADFFPSHYKYATVCDRHFVSGKSAKYNDVKNVDWVPTLNLGYQIKKECDKQEECDNNEELDFNQEVEVIEEAEVFEEAEVIEVNFKQTQTNFLKFSVDTQTDNGYADMSPDVVVSYQERIAFLEEMLNSKNITF